MKALTPCDCPGCAWGVDNVGRPIPCVRVLARERVLQLLSVEIEIWEGGNPDDDRRYVEALHDAFDALCERWQQRQGEP